MFSVQVGQPDCHRTWGRRPNQHTPTEAEGLNKPSGIPSGEGDGGSGSMQGCSGSPEPARHQSYVAECCNSKLRVPHAGLSSLPVSFWERTAEFGFSAKFGQL